MAPTWQPKSPGRKRKITKSASNRASSHPKNPTRFAVDRAELDSVARQLLAFDEPADLDVIDGGFYWDCCRVEYASRVTEMLAALPSDPVQKAVEVFDAGYLDELQCRFEVPKVYGYHRLVRGMNLPMRGPSITLHQTETDPMFTDSISLDVWSARWNGARFAKEVIAWFQHATAAGIKDGYTYLDHSAVDEKGLSIDFQRHEAHITVRVGLPLPPTTVLASAYDAYIGSDHEWKSVFKDHQSDSGQESLVAIRTWIIGLLMGSGESWSRASSTAVHDYGLDESMGIDIAQFSRDRVKLLDRVPEAEPFLRQRKPRRAR